MGPKFLHVPFQGAAPAVRDLLGRHVDAVAVSPAEVSAYVTSGEFRMLAVMADERSPGFEDVPTLKDRNIDLALETWRGLGVPEDTPRERVDILVNAARKAADEPGFRSSLAKAALGFAFADAAAFEAATKEDREFFKQLADKVRIQN